MSQLAHITAGGFSGDWSCSCSSRSRSTALGLGAPAALSVHWCGHLKQPSGRESEWPQDWHTVCAQESTTAAEGPRVANASQHTGHSSVLTVRPSIPKSVRSTDSPFQTVFQTQIAAKFCRNSISQLISLCSERRIVMVMAGQRLILAVLVLVLPRSSPQLYSGRNPVGPETAALWQVYSSLPSWCTTHSVLLQGHIRTPGHVAEIPWASRPTYGGGRNSAAATHSTAPNPEIYSSRNFVQGSDYIYNRDTRRRFTGTLTDTPALLDTPDQVRLILAA